MEGRSSEVKEYLTSVVNPLLKPMVEAIVSTRPHNVFSFIKQYAHQQLKDRNKEQESGGSQDELMSMQEEQKMRKMKEARNLKKNGGKKMSRKGISAESFGDYNKKSNFKPKVYIKSPDEFNSIKQLLLQSFMFKNLSEENLNIAIEAMQEKNCDVDEKIIDEGDIGDNLYIIGQGLFQCTKMINKEKVLIKKYKVGDIFGQLSLLYNTKRAATIKCVKKGFIFGLDRLTFNKIVQGSAIKKRAQWGKVLNKIEILSQLSIDQKQQLLDAVKEEKYQANDYVVNQGQIGDKLFFVMEGSLVAQKRTSLKQSRGEVILKYKQKEYFGEISLIKNTVRQASVKAMTKCRLLSLGRDEFKRLLGPIEEVLKRNMEKYDKFLSKSR